MRHMVIAACPECHFGTTRHVGRFAARVIVVIVELLRQLAQSLGRQGCVPRVGQERGTGGHAHARAEDASRLDDRIPANDNTVTANSATNTGAILNLDVAPQVAALDIHLSSNTAARAEYTGAD
eukprot:scaffold165723_cov27-Tisochrysis_lutea.AAC.2